MLASQTAYAASQEGATASPAPSPDRGSMAPLFLMFGRESPSASGKSGKRARLAIEQDYDPGAILWVNHLKAKS